MTLTNKELVIATSTIWVVVAAILVMFMQAGFAFLEAGLTRMKNVGHVAAKNVLVLGIASIVYYLVGYGLAFGDGGNAIVGRLRASSRRSTSCSRSARPRSAGSPRFRPAPATSSRSCSRRSRSRSSGARWPSARSSGCTSPSASSSRSSTRSSRTGSGTRTAGSSRAGCRTSPARRSCTTRARSRRSPVRCCSAPRIGKFGADGKPNAIPGHNMAFVTLGVIILWFGWFGFNPGSTLGVVTGDKLGYFAYVALTTNLAAAAGALGAVATSWIVIKKPDLSMMLNGVIAALVAITAACGFVAPWAAIVIGAVAGSIAVLGVLAVERLADRRPDRRGLGARHGGRLGHARDRDLRGACARGQPGDRHGRARVHGELPPARRAGARARSRSGSSRSAPRSVRSG